MADVIVSIFAETVRMNLSAASCGVSKTARNEASFGEFTLRD